MWQCHRKEGCLVNKTTIQDRVSEEDQGWEEDTKHGVGMEDIGSKNSRKEAHEPGVFQKGGCWTKPGEPQGSEEAAQVDTTP